MTVKELYDSFGGDYNYAIQTMMSDDFIKKMLLKFVQNNTFENVIKSYENKDYRGVFDASHSLKGVCGNLSLTPLFKKASVVCEATRFSTNNDNINLDKEIEELKQCYKDIYTSLSNYLL